MLHDGQRPTGLEDRTWIHDQQPIPLGCLPPKPHPICAGDTASDNLGAPFPGESASIITRTCIAHDQFADQANLQPFRQSSQTAG